MIKELANKPKKYINFTGIIDWYNTKGEVKNAIFELWFDMICWENGEWINGVWNKGIWWNGVWRMGTWKNGRWITGTWLNGSWEKGTWIGGLNAKGQRCSEGNNPNKW